MRNVARALNLDAAALMDRVDASLIRARSPESILVPQPMTHGTLPRRNGPVEQRGGRSLVLGAVGFALVAALIAWSGTESFERTVGGGRRMLESTRQAAAPIAPAGDATPAAAIDRSGPATMASAAGPTSDAPQALVASVGDPALARRGALTFHFTEECWVEVRGADGSLLLKRLNAAGSEQVVDGEAPFTLVVGNAKGVDLQFRGQPVDLGPYTRDSVARLKLS